MPIHHAADVGEGSVSHRRTVNVFDLVEEPNNVIAGDCVDGPRTKGWINKSRKDGFDLILASMVLGLAEKVALSDCLKGFLPSFESLGLWVNTLPDLREPFPGGVPGFGKGDCANGAKAPWCGVAGAGVADDKDEGSTASVSYAEGKAGDQPIPQQSPFARSRWLHPRNCTIS
jgi:hypothetical protein